jgi:lipoprotein-anchoring transpeptidase ErfK/SrfK
MAGIDAAAQEPYHETGPPQRRIVVSIPERKLAVIEDGRVLKIYDTAVGAAKSPTPTGEFTITIRLQHPTWYAQGKVTPPGRTNPLGTRWIGISRKGHGIHGTNSPVSIGERRCRGVV